MQKYPKSFKEELIQLYLSSKEEQTQKEFAAEHGITMDTSQWTHPKTGYTSGERRREEKKVR